jgi:hypothetical protein
MGAPVGTDGHIHNTSSMLFLVQDPAATTNPCTARLYVFLFTAAPAFADMPGLTCITDLVAGHTIVTCTCTSAACVSKHVMAPVVGGNTPLFGDQQLSVSKGAGNCHYASTELTRPADLPTAQRRAGVDKGRLR